MSASVGVLVPLPVDVDPCRVARTDRSVCLSARQTQRQRAYAHLTCTSAFLAVMALCMLSCTLVRNRSRYALAAGDKVRSAAPLVAAHNIDYSEWEVTDVK